MHSIKVAFMSLEVRLGREDGQALAEYGLILALIAVFCVAALGILALAVDGLLRDISGAL